MADAQRDNNRITTLIAVSNVDGTTPVTLYADPTTHRLLVSATAGSLDDLTDVVITSVAQGDIIYYNGTNFVNLAAGTSGKFLKTQGAGANPIWDTPTAAAAGVDTQVQFNDGGSALGGDAGFVYNKTTNVGTIGGLIISGLTASELVATDGSKNLVSLAVATYPSLTELTYVKGVTSAIQTQLGGTVKTDQTVGQTIGATGARLTKLWATDITVTNAIVGSVTGNAGTVSTITGLAPDTATTAAAQPNITSLGTLTALQVDNININGNTIISSDVNGNINLTPNGTGINVLANAQVTGLTASEIVITDGSKNLVSAAVATYPSLTELTYVKGVTSAIQTQLGTKAPTASPTFTGTVTLPTGLTGVIRADSGVVSVDTDVTDIVTAASLIAAGKVELATTAEINTGTDTTRAMPVDQFVASNRNVRYILYRVVEATTDTAVATTKGGDLELPFTGTITEIGAYVDTAGTTGTMTVDVNLNGTTIMTTNKITIDTTEKSSRTAATAPALTTTAVTAGDLITVDIDAIHTTAAKGLTIRLGIRMT